MKYYLFPSPIYVIFLTLRCGPKIQYLIFFIYNFYFTFFFNIYYNLFLQVYFYCTVPIYIYFLMFHPPYNFFTIRSHPQNWLSSYLEGPQYIPVFMDVMFSFCRPPTPQVNAYVLILDSSMLYFYRRMFDDNECVSNTNTIKKFSRILSFITCFYLTLKNGVIIFLNV